MALYPFNGTGDAVIATATTNDQGRVPEWQGGPVEVSAPDTLLRLVFYTEPYWQSKGLDSFYPCVEIPFRTQPGQHYHVPILMSPFSYSTYRGS